MTTVWLAALVLAPGLQQGGGGGFGGGGAAGAGAQGGRAGDADGETTKTHILTPGDKAEWSFDMKAGEVLVLRAQSVNFDPAIEVVDEKNKVIAENDDEEVGLQNAQVLAHFPKAGKYRALVKNYRSNAGGQYEFSIRRFLAVDAQLGKPIEARGDENFVYFRVPAPKDSTLAFSTSGGYVDQVLRPNGKRLMDDSDRTRRLGTRTYDAKEAGDYYVRALKYASDLTFSALRAEVRPLQAGVSAAAIQPAGGVDIWTYEAKPGEFLEFATSGQSLMRLHVDGRTAEGNASDAFVTIGTGKYPNVERVLVRKPIVFSAMVHHRDDGAASYEAVVRSAWRTAEVGKLATDRLRIGEAAYYGVDLAAADIVTFAAESDTFDASMRLLDAQGNELVEVDDQSWLNRNPTTTFAVPKAGKYFVEVTSLGLGGGGSFTLSLTAAAPRSLAVGASVQHTAATPYDGVFDLTVGAEKVIGIRIRGGRAGGVAAYGPDGAAHRIQIVNLQNGELLAILLPEKPGRYRLWATGIAPGASYSVSAADMSGG